jgi:predicted kinase
MTRLPEEATLQQHLRRGAVEAPLLERLARTLAAFHAGADRGEHIAAFGRFEVVAGNARENIEQALPQVRVTLSPGVCMGLRALTEETLQRLRPLIEERARRGVPCDTHGDLHLDHVYLFPDRPPPQDLVIIDGIEFNERFRYADPVADMAFLVMDLKFHGRRDLAGAFADAYFRAAGAEGRALLPFYTAYRAMVRGKVEGFELREKEIPEEERNAALARARAHWLLALTELEEPGRRPCLLLVGGLPGTGKSTLSRWLAERAGFTVVRADLVRKELAGIPAVGRTSSLDEGIYTPEWTERTYAECLRQAGELLFAGGRVLVDATFGQERWRRAALEQAVRWGVPAALLLRQAPPEVVRRRLANRHGDVSDADWSVYQLAVQRWEEPGAATRSSIHAIDSDDSVEAMGSKALEVLRTLGLA